VPLAKCVQQMKTLPAALAGDRQRPAAVLRLGLGERVPYGALGGTSPHAFAETVGKERGRWAL
jgi:hypothetical protein